MKRVLLVEDNLGDARLAQEMLSESPDFEVDVTCVGRLNQAVEVLTNQSFDVVLLDLSLPDSNRLEGLQRLQPLSKEAPIIVLTGLEDKAQALEALKQGAQDYLLKGTMNPEALIRVIQYSMERRASDARYRSLVANIPGVVYHCQSDKGGALLFASSSFETLTGYSVNEFIAKAPGGFSALIHPDDRERTICMLLGAVTRKQPYAIEYRIRRKDGQIRWIFDRGQGVGPAHGGLPNRDGVLFDITEQHAMEEKFYKADQQLRQAEQFAAMGNLACGVAHDFNNVITAIIGFADLVVQDLSPDTRAHSRMLQIRKAGQRAVAITQHLLALGKTTMKEPAILDMNLLLTDMERMIRLVTGVRCEITMVSDPFLGRIKGNPRELEQALLILAMNIIQGHGEEAHLRIETRTWNVDGKDAEAGGVACCDPFAAVVIRAVSPGELAYASSVPQCLMFPENEEIDEEERFGMATVLKIVTEHHGYCFVTEDDTEISEYTLVFPVALIDQEALVFNHTSQTLLRTGSETVLVVDDEDTVRMLIRELLEANGYRVLDASDGTQALHMSEQHKEKIDLLIVDEVMPGLSGHELTAQMAELRPQLCALPMSTVKPQFMFQEKPFLMKPFTADVLLKRVGEALQDGPIGRAAA